MKKCLTLSFTLVAGRLLGEFKAGFRVTEIGNGSKFGVHLGAKGEGAWYRNIEFLRKTPPEVKETKKGDTVVARRIYEANLVELEGEGKEHELRTFYVLAGHIEDEVGSDGILLRVNTKGIPTAKAVGEWKYPNGRETESKLLGWGTRAEGDEKSCWWDGIVTLYPGNVLWVRPEGGEEIPIYYDPKKKCLAFVTKEKANWLVRNTDTADIPAPVPATSATAE